MPSPVLDPHRLLGWASPAEHGLREAIRWGSHHSGLPMVVVAALAVVVSWRLAKRAARLAIEVVVVTAMLLAATRLGWIAW
jgi:hypothetical protein